ncbi:extracellular solute-binding protein [Paenibacillus lycopersici]|uniref:Extracellular solute-binding protein n=1 Tax=Paenibacillus lycopersici TaxID=2704462 RepID=A0A6C0FYW6_9BACL|nr:DUF3502 domain-containing protein [Paenibacillus lycopersici]QHT62318.1 extracellular solute-binding protein [Paenibacillus lycopersici]
MRKKRKSLITALAALMLSGAALAGCGSGNGASSDDTSANNGAAASDTAASNNGGTANAAEEKTGDANLKNHVDLVWYTVGDPAPDQDAVMAEFNKMLEKDMNTTIKLNFTSWNDWQTKYNLLLTTGEKVDLVYAANWLDFYKLAKQGAYQDITDLIPTYMPETYKTIPQEDWEAAKVGGKTYAVPNTLPNWSADGVYYREDWRQELNLPEIKDIDTLGAYLDGVKKNKANVIPYNGNPYDGLLDLFTFSTDFQLLGGYSSPVASQSYDHPRDIVIYPFTQEYADYVKKMKQWADAGYWSKNALTAKQQPEKMIQAGTGAIQWGNVDKASGFITDMKTKAPDMKLAYWNFSNMHNYVMADPTTNNAMAVPKSAQHAERALMVLDKLRNDPAYYNMLTYGLQGKDYDMDADGKHIVVPPAGADPKTFTGYNIASWGWTYAPNVLTTKTPGWEGFDAQKAAFAKMSKPNIFAGLAMDFDPVKSELAAVNSVVDQYGKPLMLGLVKDVDQSLKTYQDKLKAAGVDKLADYIKQEATAYFDEKGIQ